MGWRRLTEVEGPENRPGAPKATFASKPATLTPEGVVADGPGDLYWQKTWKRHDAAPNRDSRFDPVR